MLASTALQRIVCWQHVLSGIVVAVALALALVAPALALVVVALVVVAAAVVVQPPRNCWEGWR